MQLAISRGEAAVSAVLALTSRLRLGATLGVRGGGRVSLEGPAGTLFDQRPDPAAFADVGVTWRFGDGAQ